MKFEQGMTGWFVPGYGKDRVRAKVTHVWTDACANLECEDGAMPTSVLMKRPDCAGYYFEPDEPKARQLTDHMVNPANAQLRIEVADEPGAGGANHLYVITGFDSTSNPSDPFVARHGAPAKHSTVLFQNGPINEVGVNGATHEALLAILIDRLRAFQKGPYVCRENALALTKLEEAMMWLNERTRGRAARGVEGTHTV